jgi:hypothetical protein
MFELQTRASALFEIPTSGWLNRPGYERLIAEVTGGLLATRPAQHFYDVDYGDLGQVEWSVTRSGRPWIDGLRVADAVRRGYAETLHYGFIRYRSDWIEAVTFVPLLDIYRMLGLEHLGDALLDHAFTVRANAVRRSGWPRGHISLHRTVEQRDVLELLQADQPGFTGNIRLQARLDYFEQTLKGARVACAVFDPATGDWQVRNRNANS